MKKRLLYCTHEQFWPLTGGCTAGNFHIMKYLSRNGFEVTVSTPFYSDCKDFEREHQVKMEPFSPFYMHRAVRFRTPRYIIYGFLSIFHLLKLSINNAYDIVYVNNTVMALPFLILRPFIKRPIVLRYTDLLSGFLSEDKKCPPWLVYCLRFYEYRIAKIFDRVYVITERMRHALCSKSGIEAENVVVSLDGVDSCAFDENKLPRDNRDELRTMLNIPLEAKLIICHGTIEPHHGEYILTEIVERLTSARDDIYFMIIGVGKGYQTIKEKLKDNERVRTLDFVDYGEIPKYIDASDVGIVPYPKNDSMDLVLTLKLLEYLALGIPCVLFDLESVKDIFNRCEFVKTSKDMEEFVENILRMTEYGRSNEAIDLIKQRFTWEAVAEKIREDLFFLTEKVR